MDLVGPFPYSDVSMKTLHVVRPSKNSAWQFLVEWLALFQISLK